jgi:hypothetical protein
VAAEAAKVKKAEKHAAFKVMEEARVETRATASTAKVKKQAAAADAAKVKKAEKQAAFKVMAEARVEARAAAKEREDDAKKFNAEAMPVRRDKTQVDETSRDETRQKNGTCIGLNGWINGCRYKLY